MREADALQLIAETLATGLNLPSAVLVSADGFPIHEENEAAARWLGTAGRVVQATFEGWGAAFEHRRIRTQLVVNLQSDRDELVQAVLLQKKSLLHYQNSLRVRANAHGIDRPLRRDAFIDPGRLRVDEAAARALHVQLGSDARIRDWLRKELEQVCAIPRPRVRPSVSVHGLVLTVPFLLAPLELAEGRHALRGRPCWSDNELSVLKSDAGCALAAYAQSAHAMLDTPLQGREIIHGETWPADHVLKALGRWRARHDGDGHGGHPMDPSPTEWRILLEPCRISVAEAFC